MVSPFVASFVGTLTAPPLQATEIGVPSLPFSSIAGRGDGEGMVVCGAKPIGRPGLGVIQIIQAGQRWIKSGQSGPQRRGVESGLGGTLLTQNRKNPDLALTLQVAGLSIVTFKYVSAQGDGSPNIT
jgi:hypothetical protein